VRRPQLSRQDALAGLRGVAHYLIASLAVALLALPLAAEQAVEDVSFDDAVGTLPVEMSLCHQGRSALETGVLGDLYWQQTGAFGLGIQARVTAPPQAGGTLASYVDPRFLKANLEFIDDPDAAVATYVSEFESRIVTRTLTTALVAGLLGGVVVVVLLRRGAPGRETARHRRVVLVALTVAGLALSTGGAAFAFDRWSCNQDPDPGYAFPGVPQLRFSSPQTLELARQIRPFIEKNTARIEQRTDEYTHAAEQSFGRALERRGAALEPRDGEVMVLAEADPQGSYVGARVRTSLEAALVDALGPDAVALRTISGDVTSNGTVAEDDYVAREAEVGGELPTVAVSGDHDSAATQQQMLDHGMVVPDLGVDEVAGLRVAGADDVEHKALFGELVTNGSGLTEQQLGARLRDEVPGDRSLIVLLHQPDAVAGYLGLDTLDPVRGLRGSYTKPYDDGLPDVPPGTIDVGHLHDFDGPWVLWNTDGDHVTWTVVDQLGTAGGVEEQPTFNRFSTPVSIPLKDISFRLQWFDTRTGLQTGFASVACDVDGRCHISRRTDVGLPLGR